MPLGIEENINLEEIERIDYMQQLRKQLTHLIRHGLALSDKAETEIITLISRSATPLTLTRFFLQIYHLTQFWTFLPSHKKEIIETLDQELTESKNTNSYIQLMDIVFSREEHTGHSDSGAKHGIALIKKLMAEEQDLTIHAGLSILLIKIVKLYQNKALPYVTLSDLLPALLFDNDNVSYTSLLHMLFDVYGEHAVIPLLVDLLLKNPRKIDAIFLHSIYEYSLTQINRHHQLHLIDKIRALLEIQHEIYGQKNIPALLDEFFIRLGRINYVLSKVSQCSIRNFMIIKPTSPPIISRLSLLQKAKGATQ
jgi:hypothetical protein